jgi:hypothetical protein
MDADGQHPTRLEADSGHNDADGNWSPDGTKIVFASDKGGSYQIYTASAAGGSATPVKSTSDGQDDGFPDWGPPPVEHAPAVTVDSYGTAQDTPLSVSAPGVLANDSDSDGDPLSAVLDSGPSHGTLNLAADGSFSYTPGSGFSGSDSFTYHASDGIQSSASVTVTVGVTAAPAVTEPPPPGPPPEGGGGPPAPIGPTSRELGGTVVQLGSFEPGGSAPDRPIAGAGVEVVDPAGGHHQATTDLSGQYLVTGIGACPAAGARSAAANGGEGGNSGNGTGPHTPPGNGGTGGAKACGVTVTAPPDNRGLGAKHTGVMAQTTIHLGADPSLTARDFRFGARPHELFVAGVAQGQVGAPASTMIRLFDGPPSRTNALTAVSGLTAGSFGPYLVEFNGTVEKGGARAAASGGPGSTGADKLTVMLDEAGHAIDSAQVKVPAPGDGEAIVVHTNLQGIFPVPHKSLGRVLEGGVVRLRSFEPGAGTADIPIPRAKVEVTDASGHHFDDTTDAQGHYLISGIGPCSKGGGAKGAAAAPAGGGKPGGACELVVNGRNADTKTAVDLGSDPSVTVRNLRFGDNPNQLFVAGTVGGDGGGLGSATIHVFDRKPRGGAAFAVGRDEVASFPGLAPGGIGAYRLELGKALSSKGSTANAGFTLHPAASGQTGGGDAQVLSVVLFVAGRPAGSTQVTLPRSGAGRGDNEAIVVAAKPLQGP